MIPHTQSVRQSSGFTLLEIAVVLVILGVLLGGLVTPLSTQRALANQRETERLLEEVQSALIGYAIVNGRLPCPATLVSNGAAAPAIAGACTLQHGFVPARTLGLNGQYNAANLLLDSWHNPIKYSLPLTALNQYSTDISLPLASSNLRICRNSTCLANEIIADGLMAVIISRGEDGATVPTSPDQLVNYKPENNPTLDFIVHESSELAGSEFDDVVRWIAPAQLILPMVKGGALP